MLSLIWITPTLAAASFLQRSPLPRRLKAVVLDADGTFLDPQHKVSEANAAAILAAREAGLKVFLATGRARSGPWVPECLEPLALDKPGVFNQGLTSFDAANNRVHNAKISSSAVAIVQSVCEQAVQKEGAKGITLAAYVQERLVVACGDECDPWLMRYATYGDGDIELAGEGPSAQIEANRDARGAAPVEACSVDSTDLSACLDDDVANANKLLVLSDEDSVDSLRAALEIALEGQPARVVKALDWTLEILPEGTSKAAGLRLLLRELGIDPFHVMAVGDGENDIEMMQMVGLPVAMGACCMRAACVLRACTVLHRAGCTPSCCVLRLLRLTRRLNTSATTMIAELALYVCTHIDHDSGRERKAIAQGNHRLHYSN